MLLVGVVAAVAGLVVVAASVAVVVGPAAVVGPVATGSVAVAARACGVTTARLASWGGGILQTLTKLQGIALYTQNEHLLVVSMLEMKHRSPAWRYLWQRSSQNLSSPLTSTHRIRAKDFLRLWIEVIASELLPGVWAYRSSSRGGRGRKGCRHLGIEVGGVVWSLTC